MYVILKFFKRYIRLYSVMEYVDFFVYLKIYVDLKFIIEIF